MATFTRSDDLQGAEFVGTDLRGARFVGADLSGVVMRGVDVRGGGHRRTVALRRRELPARQRRRRDPARRGRAQPPLSRPRRRRAGDPDGLRAAWAALERTWAATLERVAAMPAGTVDVSVGGEWSFAQTLRHLVMATDMWLGRAILEIEQPFHPLGQLPRT